MRSRGFRPSTLSAVVFALGLAMAGCGDRVEPRADAAVERARTGRASLAAAEPGDTVSRMVAVTFDDLPAVAPDLPAMRQVTDRLMASFRRNGVPVVGFVNERKLEEGGEGEIQARVALLRQWIDGGHELGNHTYSHTAITAAPLARVQDDVVRGEPVTRALLAERGMPLRYFRHPQLRTGADADTREAYARFLAGRGYTVAPVTFDNQEWVFAGAYMRALARGDTAAARCVGQAYVPYMESTFAFFEDLSRDVVGREVPQVLLLHANALNADHFGALAEVLKRRGYRFVTLERALADPAYRLPDGYVGSGGPSWLHRWAAAKGQPMPPEPREPELIARLNDRARAASVRVPADCMRLPPVSGAPAPRGS